MGLQPEDAIFLGAFASLLAGTGFVLKEVVLGDAGLFEQMANPSDAKAQAGENARSRAAGGVPGLGFLRLPDLDFVEVYGDARSVDRQDGAGIRLGGDRGQAVTIEEEASEAEAAETELATQGTPTPLEALSLSLAEAVEAEDYFRAAAIKAEIDALTADMDAVRMEESSPVSRTRPPQMVLGFNPMRTSQAQALKAELLTLAAKSRAGIRPLEEAEQARFERILTEELPALRPMDEPTRSDLFSGEWECRWTDEKELNFAVKNGLFGLPWRRTYQTIDIAAGTLVNVLDFDGGELRVGSTIAPDATDGTRFNFAFGDCSLTWRSLRVPLPPIGKGWGELLYLDEEMRIQRDIRGDMIVATRVLPQSDQRLAPPTEMPLDRFRTLMGTLYGVAGLAHAFDLFAGSSQLFAAAGVPPFAELPLSAQALAAVWCAVGPLAFAASRQGGRVADAGLVVYGLVEVLGAALVDPTMTPPGAIAALPNALAVQIVVAASWVYSATRPSTDASWQFDGDDDRM